MQKIKDIKIYTYCYKLDEWVDLWKNREEFNDYFKKIWNLQMGVMIDEITTSKKLFGDFINDCDDEYYKQQFKNVPQSWIDEEREKIKNITENKNSINYEILYKYNLIATKQLIIKNEELEQRLKILEEKINNVHTYL